MKRFLLPVLLIFLFAEAFSQILAGESGIGIQGIARDDNNNALSNQNVSLRFSLYYYNESNAETSVFIPKSEELTTDAFGVFSYVLEVEPQYYPVIAYYEVYLKIEVEEGGNVKVISNEKLKQVPYAISAGNGVPPGSIMPYVGETAPPGWVLCQGQNISNVPGSAVLRNLLGKGTVPDLRGMFLRGSGMNQEYQKEGPALLQTQADMFSSHNHKAGDDLVTADGGAHQHNLRSEGTANPGGAFRSINFTRINGGFMSTFFSQIDGEHTHQIEGNTADTGGEETRPINLGVNYIIKL